MTIMTATFSAVTRTDCGFEWDIFSAPKASFTVEAKNAAELEAATKAAMATEAFAAFLTSGAAFCGEMFAVKASFFPARRERKFANFDKITRARGDAIFAAKPGVAA